MRYGSYEQQSSPRLRFGKYAGWRISEVPLSYVTWLFAEGRINYSLREDLREEIARRIGASLSPRARPHQLAPPADIADAVAAIVAAGYRREAQRCHPDTGGQHADMLAVNAAKSWLDRMIEGA